MKILHVTECFDGGVSRAIQSIADLIPEHEHHVLASGGDIRAQWLRNFSSVKALEGNLFARTVQLHRITSRADFDLVHAHSSWAGLYARLLPINARLVYQPHCYATEMNAGLRRLAFAAAEMALGLRRQTVVVLSPRERELARRYSPRASIQYVPNAPSINSRSSEEPSHGSLEKLDQKEPVVVSAGRLSAQKDPAYFAEVARATRKEMPAARFIWIGGGAENERLNLLSAGVEVTGWVEPEALGAELDRASVYLHTAAWEGFPLSVLDASARGLAVIVRDIPAFDGLRIQRVNDVQDATAAVLAVLRSTATRQANIVDTRDALAGMTRPQQRLSLQMLYEDNA